MSDDIVTRLRGCWCANAFSDRGKVDPACDHDGVRADAADEIERLRADRDRWRALAEYLCQNAPSVVVPDEIACQFPSPLAVRGD